MDPLKTIEYADYLLSLDEEDRKKAGRSLNDALVLKTPDEELDKPPVRTLGEYLDTPIEVPPILVEPGIVAVGAVSALISRGGKGKTALSLNRLIRWGMGKPLFDEVPDLLKPRENDPLKILVIENEGNGGHFQMILGRILGENGFTDEEIETAREHIHIWGDGGWSGLKVDEDKDFDLIKRGVSTTECDLLFVEPFRGLWRGEENNSTDMAFVCDRMSEVANTFECGVLLTHHERKSGSGEGEGGDPMSAARGSGALEGAAAVMERWVPVKAGKQRELSCIKNRFAEPFAPLRMEYNREKWGYKYIAEDENHRVVKTVLAQSPGTWFTAQEVANEVDENLRRTRDWLNEIAEDSDQPVTKQRDVNIGAMVYRYKGSDSDPGDGGIDL